MKKFVDLKNEDFVLYVGTAREIKRAYYGLNRTEKALGSHCDEPKFNFNKLYGLHICNLDEKYPTMYIVNEHTLVGFMADPYIVLG